MAQTLTHTNDHVAQGSWDGASEPFKASYGKLMMWYFLLSDAFTFSGFLIAYGSLRMSSPSWPVPDFVFSTFPGGIHHAPLLFVTLMTFILLASSYTMVRAVQEGHRENKNGVVIWMVLTIIGGLGFLGCQAWEWNTLINGESVSYHTNPFGTHTEYGKYLEGDGHDIAAGDTFHPGTSYLIHNHDGTWGNLPYEVLNSDGTPVMDDDGKPLQKTQAFGPKAFGALFFCITGFHGFHVFSGVAFLLIICVNAASGLYEERKNGYEMVEKIGLYWHFVDLVWVFVFLVFYLL
jgi:cytochrome c oxidase subunit III